MPLVYVLEGERQLWGEARSGTHTMGRRRESRESVVAHRSCADATGDIRAGWGKHGVGHHRDVPHASWLV